MLVFTCEGFHTKQHMVAMFHRQTTYPWRRPAVVTTPFRSGWSAAPAGLFGCRREVFSDPKRGCRQLCSPAHQSLTLLLMRRVLRVDHSNRRKTGLPPPAPWGSCLICRMDRRHHHPRAFARRRLSRSHLVLVLALIWIESNTSGVDVAVACGGRGRATCAAAYRG